MWVHEVHAPYVGEVWVCITCAEKTLGLSATSRESVQSETEKSRVSRRECSALKACHNGDNKLQIDEWRPVN